MRSGASIKGRDIQDIFMASFIRLSSKISLTNNSITSVDNVKKVTEVISMDKPYILGFLYSPIIFTNMIFFIMSAIGNAINEALLKNIKIPHAMIMVAIASKSIRGRVFAFFIWYFLEKIVPHGEDLFLR